MMTRLAAMRRAARRATGHEPGQISESAVATAKAVVVCPDGKDQSDACVAPQVKPYSPLAKSSFGRARPKIILSRSATRPETATAVKKKRGSCDQARSRRDAAARRWRAARRKAHHTAAEPASQPAESPSRVIW